MSLAKKLREVVAANFVEIARPDKDTAEPAKEGNPSGTNSDTNTGWDAAPPVGLLENEEASAVSETDGTPTNVAEAVVYEADTTVIIARAPDAELVALAASPDPMDLIAEDGSVSYEAVYLRMDVPRSAAFTAEQALHLLTTMPSDFSLRVKRLTVKATLDAVGQTIGATPADIVTDAERKKIGLDGYISEITLRTEEIRAEKEEEIAQLKAHIADVEASIKRAEQKKFDTIAVTQSHMEQFDQVIAFFTVSEETGMAQSDDEESAEEGELPSFLQDDTVMRLLGINSAAEEKDAVTSGAGATTTERGS